jgi:cobalt/nickel transport system ATP-binding protein
MTSALSVRDVRFRYPDGRLALDGVDLEVGQGERVALLGPNGAGKTTLLLQLNGLLDGDGVVEVAGLPIAGEAVWEARRRIGFVFQDPDDQLFLPTVAEDVAFAPRNAGLEDAAVRARVAEALAAVGMEHVADRAPYALSGGERRRVAIATVLAQRPDVLVLDEPSANLDPRARRELIEVLDGLDRTLVMATHDLPLALALCDRAVILERGRVVADGRCAELLADAGLLAEHDLELPEGLCPHAVLRACRATCSSSSTSMAPCC